MYSWVDCAHSNSTSFIFSFNDQAFNSCSLSNARNSIFHHQWELFSAAYVLWFVNHNRVLSWMCRLISSCTILAISSKISFWILGLGAEVPQSCYLLCFVINSSFSPSSTRISTKLPPLELSECSLSPAAYKNTS